MTYRIYSYNVNGIRSAINKGFMDWFIEEKPDILSLQEVKANEDQVNLKPFHDLGYKTYWYPAEKKGYSGVALITKIEPDYVEYGMNIKAYDGEARLIRADFGNLTSLSVYFPSGTTGELRQSFKMKFLDDFLVYIETLKVVRPNIIISGDINIAHKEVDINFPKKHLKSSGFLPEERLWVDNFISSGFIDTFRVINQLPEQYSWWSYRTNARQRNLGWRIDYIYATANLKDFIRHAQIHNDACHSDHCPISLELDISCL
jgi:exodeoxyribonuclease-3